MVHTLGGVCGVCAAVVLGKRKVAAEVVDTGSIPPSSPALVTLGTPYFTFVQILYIVLSKSFIPPPAIKIEQKCFPPLKKLRPVKSPYASLTQII